MSDREPAPIGGNPVLGAGRRPTGLLRNAAPTTSTEPRPRRFLRVAEVAALFGLSTPTVYRAIKDGDFPAIKVRNAYVVPALVVDQMEADAMAHGLVNASDYVLNGGAA